MIRELQIQGFKRFANQTFTLQPLTVLAGMNGTGKTSVVHALILAREAWRRGDGIVELNGPFGLELGDFDDVLNHETLGSFSIKILDNELNENELNEYEWTFSEGTCVETLEAVLDRVDDAQEHGHGCCYSDELFCLPVRDGRTFYELYDADTPLAIPQDVQQRVAVAFSRMQTWQEIDASWPTDFEVVVGEGPLEKAPSIAWAHAQAILGATSAVACIAHQLMRANGQVSVIVAEKTIPVWFVSNARDYERFFRWLIVETTSSPDEMEELSASAFHSLDFVEGAFSGVKHMSKPYIDVAPAIVDHLAAFSDEGRRIFSGPGNRVAAEFGPFGVDISDESGRTKRNNKARAKRTVVVNGNARVFWWHSKLEPHQNRIYICPEKIREGGRILVGIFCNHL